MNEKAEYCAVPLDFQLSFSEKVDKVYNVQNVKEGINISGNQKVIINTGVVYLKGKDSEVFYSPEKSETAISKEFQKLMNIKLDSTLRKLDDLNQRISKWDSTLVRFAKVLEKLPNDNPKKPQGIELLKQYKQNIQTASCLNNDYGDQVIIETDEQGNKDYLFDIEKIKNDPNYLFVGNEIEGFVIVKKSNKYGFLSTDDSYKDIPFRYEKVRPFKFGRAVVEDRERIYVIDKKSNELFSFAKSSTGFELNPDFSSQYKAFDILPINESRFLMKGILNGVADCSVLINQTGGKLSDCYNTLEQIKGSSSILKGTTIESIHAEYQGEKQIFKEIEKSFVDTNGTKIFDKKINLKKFKFKLKGNKFKQEIARVEDLIAIANAKKYVLIFSVFNSYDTLYYYTIIEDLKKSRNLNCLSLPVKESEYRVNRKNHLFFYLKDYSNSESKILLTGVSYDEESYSSKKSFKPYLNIPNKKITQDNYKIKNDDTSTHVINLHKNSLSVQKQKRHTIYNFSENRYIDILCDSIIGIDSDSERIIFTSSIIISKDKSIYTSESSGFGVSNFDGLYIIPPIFENIDYSSSNSNIEAYTFDNKTIIFDKEGNCLNGDCDTYKQLKNNYFYLLNTFQD
ncbi:hypothetical protein [uncultured Lacinutrix sp.]|uniref:hypothetical protein n=1 Tax=uncultured Lacinutrix sp. TaxID=574032 RepID=UPI00262F2C60|nr:hypothetical protein [uncultured Lacinutrix sp.]